MQTLSPFETIRRSRWAQKMLMGAGRDMSREDVPWYQRGMAALPQLGLEGQEIHASYLRDRLAKIIGYPTHGRYVSQLVMQCVRRGMLIPTGRKINMPGTVNKQVSYIVSGQQVDRSTVEGSTRREV